jgi:hypothetical protein
MPDVWWLRRTFVSFWVVSRDSPHQGYHQGAIASSENISNIQELGSLGLQV